MDVWGELEGESGDAGIVVRYDMRSGHPYPWRIVWRVNGVEGLAKQLGKGGEPVAVLSVINETDVRARPLPAFADRPEIVRYVESLVHAYQPALRNSRRPQAVWSDFQAQANGSAFSMLVLTFPGGRWEIVERGADRKRLETLMEQGATPLGYVTCRDGVVAGTLLWTRRDNEQDRAFLAKALEGFRPMISAWGYTLAETEMESVGAA